jgi:hypothetical protein
VAPGDFIPSRKFSGNQTTQKINENGHLGGFREMKKSNSAKINAQKSKRGGLRAGAGRKPGSRNKSNNDHLFEPCANALASALDGSQPLEFIFAMWCLNAPLEASRAALGVSQDVFAAKYGQAIAVFMERQRLGMEAQQGRAAA